MSEYLFVYGSLKRGYGGAETTALLAQVIWLGPAQVRGRLYDFSNYCGAILDPSGDQTIKGELLEIADGSTLGKLDQYENYEPENSDSLFVRRATTVTLANGSMREAWIYVYNLDPGDAPVIKSGEYAKHGQGELEVSRRNQRL